jgi:hypothetical protein
MVKVNIMKKNMGSADRIIRWLIAVIFVILYLTKVITGFWGIIMLLVALMFVVTSIFSFCPLYLPFGINTCKKMKS